MARNQREFSKSGRTSRRFVAGAAAAVFLMAGAGAAQASEEVDRILQAYAQDYQSDATLTKATTFGVEVAGEWWTVTATPGGEGGAARVTASRGAPAAPTFYYTFESAAVLGDVDQGNLNMLTAMAKAYSSDVTPADIGFMDGFEPPEGLIADVLPLTFHFWTRGRPELIPFDGEKTRVSHGANLGIFYYQPGFRSGWFEVRPGQHVNEPEDQQTNPFPSMMIMLDGEATGKIDGEEFQFTEGAALFVPAGVSHEFWNDGDEPAFGLLFMFGDGA